MVQAKPSFPLPDIPTPQASASEAGDADEAVKRKRSLRIGIAFVALVALGFLVWLFASGTADSFFSAITHADLGWMAAGAACFVAYFLLDVLCFRVAGMLAGVRMGPLDLFSVASAGIVFGYLTPGQTGGAPAQIVRLSQVGLKVGDATAVQLTKFFIYQAAVTVFGAVVLATKSSYFRERFGDIVLVSVFSFSVHVLIMAALVAVVFFPNIVRRVCHALVRLACRVARGRVRVLSDAGALHARVDAEVDEYAGSVRSAVRHASVVGTAMVVTLLQLGCLYCIPYCVVRALGGEGVDLPTALCCAAFVQLIMTAVPLPGGTGGAEGGFLLFFGPELGSLATAGVVLWRTLTFYLPVVACAPQLGLHSRMTPAQRMEEFGEAHVGREGARDAARIARRRTCELRDAAGERIHSKVLTRGGRTYVVVRGDASGLGSTRRLRRRARGKVATVKFADLGEDEGQGAQGGADDARGDSGRR